MEEVQRITQYASLRDACFLTARQWQARQAAAATTEGTAGGPLLRSTEDVKCGVVSGNLDDMLELALRYGFPLHGSSGNALMRPQTLHRCKC